MLLSKVEEVKGHDIINKVETGGIAKQRVEHGSRACACACARI